LGTFNFTMTNTSKNLIRMEQDFLVDCTSWKKFFSSENFCRMISPITSVRLDLKCYFTDVWNLTDNLSRTEVWLRDSLSLIWQTTLSLAVCCIMPRLEWQLIFHTPCFLVCAETIEVCWQRSWSWLAYDQTRVVWLVKCWAWQGRKRKYSRKIKLCIQACLISCQFT